MHPEAVIKQYPRHTERYNINWLGVIHCMCCIYSTIAYCPNLEILQQIASLQNGTYVVKGKILAQTSAVHMRTGLS